MKQIVLDTTIHELTAVQILEICMRHWNEDRTALIILVTEAGKASQIVGQVRTALSTLRRKARGANQYIQNFGIESTSLPVSYQLDTITKEAVMVNYRITQLQVMKNLTYREGIEV